MNLLPTYEQTIANKRDGIEVPDMADAIWGRIEAVLDVEMPEPATPPPVQGTPFYKRPAVWIISAGILAIIIAVFILSKDKTAPAENNQPQHTVPTTKPDTIQQYFKPPDDPPKPATKKSTKTIIQPHIIDTATHNPFIIAEDSVLKKPPIIIAPPARLTIPPLDVKQRPKYGVDVSDSEYLFKIKPKQ